LKKAKIAPMKYQESPPAYADSNQVSKDEILASSELTQSSHFMPEGGDGKETIETAKFGSIQVDDSNPGNHFNSVTSGISQAPLLISKIEEDQEYYY